jgi:hypothetical protein
MMKRHRPVTVTLVGACAANVALAFVDSAFGKAKDPLARFPPAGTVYTLAGLSSASIAVTTTTVPDMNTGAPRDLLKVLPIIRQEQG